MKAATALSFESSLVQQHTLGGVEAALQINPSAGLQSLLGAASARMQALINGIGAWMLVEEETDAPLQEILRPFEHLAEEVENLLEAAHSRLVGVAASREAEAAEPAESASATGPGDDDADRTQIAREATWEVDALLSVLRDLTDGWSTEIAPEEAMAARHQVRGLYARIRQLNSIAMSVLDDDDDTSHLRRELQGVA